MWHDVRLGREFFARLLAIDAARAEQTRVAIVASLAQAMVAALDAGDAEAARVAHDAIGRLLRGRQGDGAEVVDLATWRAQK